MTTLIPQKPLNAPATSTTALPVGRTSTAPRPTPAPTASLQRAWRDALAEEERTVAPWERMGLALLAFAAVGALLAAVGATSRLVEGLPLFTEWVGRLLG